MKYKFAPAFIYNFLSPFYDLVVAQGGLGKVLQGKVLQYAQVKDGETISIKAYNFLKLGKIPRLPILSTSQVH